MRAKKDDGLKVLMALRSSLEAANADLGDAYSLAADTKAVTISDDVDVLQRSTSDLLSVLENHWPTIDPSGRCHGCPRCTPAKSGNDEKIVLTVAEALALRLALESFPALAKLVGEAAGLVGQLREQGTVKASTITFWITYREGKRVGSPGARR